ncbi:ankyrin repeat domain-containing protein [Kineococcus sp. NPDC059986]|uniref:ankyrin repeat domain-containing protein n=1 Tax=Kineococcus sp. NPDC059986 TaxID=3155538 RepID=UPI00344CAEF0
MTQGLTEDELRFLHETFDLARDGVTAVLAARVDAGVPVDLTNSAGDTLLVLAAYHGHPDTVRALLERGADHARVNDKGQTALGAAVFRQSHEIVGLLLDAGADPTLGRQSGLAVADVFDLPEMTQLLTKHPQLRASGPDGAAAAG